MRHYDTTSLFRAIIYIFLHFFSLKIEKIGYTISYSFSLLTDKNDMIMVVLFTVRELYEYYCP